MGKHEMKISQIVVMDEEGKKMTMQVDEGTYDVGDIVEIDGERRYQVMRVWNPLDAIARVFLQVICL